MRKRIHQILSMMLFLCPGIIRVGGDAGGGLPRFTYTGTYTLLDDGNRNWRIKFLTSGTFTPAGTMYVDVFGVGAGGGAAANGGHAGAGGGYTRKIAHQLIGGTSYTVLIGAGGNPGSNGGTTSFAVSGTTLLSAAGGFYATTDQGAAGGSGGSGYYGGFQTPGTDGSNGGAGPGGGQGTTTREFGDANGTLYSTGGIFNAGANGAPNTGDGAGGMYGSIGGSGILVIRNQRAA
jgi:hypothetical protein